MSLILQIETATSSCSVALALNGNCISCVERNEPNIHATHLTLFIEDVLHEAGKTIRDLDAVAVSKGPGSYTGLRIGVSTAKGLCYALDIPLIAVNTLEAMAFGFKNANAFSGESLFCPMIDARRMEVYTSLYTSDLVEKLPVQAKIIDESSFQEFSSNRKLVFFGSGANKCKPVLEQNENAVFYDDFVNSASHLTTPAFNRFQKNEFEDTAYFEPFYLKDFISTQPKR